MPMGKLLSADYMGEKITKYLNLRKYIKMKLLKTAPKLALLMGMLNFELMQKCVAPWTVILEDNTLRLINYGKELHCKYSSVDDNGSHVFSFTAELLEKLDILSKKQRNTDDLIVTLFCEGSEQPCYLTYTEFQELSAKARKSDYLTIHVKLKARSFNLYAGSKSDGAKMTISKRANNAKLTC